MLKRQMCLKWLIGYNNYTFIYSLSVFGCYSYMFLQLLILFKLCDYVWYISILLFAPVITKCPCGYRSFISCHIEYVVLLILHVIKSSASFPWRCKPELNSLMIAVIQDHWCPAQWSQVTQRDTDYVKLVLLYRPQIFTQNPSKPDHNTATLNNNQPVL